MKTQMSAEFWLYLEELVNGCSIIIDRQKGTVHSEFTSQHYPLDYGYLQEMNSVDGGDLDVWVGEKGDKKITAIVNTVDLRKKDIEMKLLLSCSEGDIKKILEFHNSGSKLY